ncbi:hypothetical protein CLAVI_000718 [Candidatus Clavichlamydia salmonicola]|uniref:hypothetical protein n=1 Tax=Candidatus Clavichlamydia salmonicola TaxID=469812 RepID=UPI001890F82D|nr:hypothetical protein [Candidatus Clavichlamydia salmonicola]MBF5051087.1 hypothetical protein [Candidatus Clavichlamydia salmonicola]
MSINKIKSHNSPSSSSDELPFPIGTPPSATSPLAAMASIVIQRSSSVNSSSSGQLDPCETSDRSGNNSPFSPSRIPRTSHSPQTAADPYIDPWTGEPLSLDDAAVFYKILTPPGTPLSSEGKATSKILVQKALAFSGQIVSRSLSFFELRISEEEREKILQAALKATKHVILQSIKEAIQEGCGEGGLNTSCLNLALHIGSQLGSKAYRWITERASAAAERSIERAIDNCARQAASVVSTNYPSNLPSTVYSTPSSQYLQVPSSYSSQIHHSQPEEAEETTLTIKSISASDHSFGKLATSTSREPATPQPPSIGALEARFQGLTCEEDLMPLTEKHTSKKRHPKLKLAIPTPGSAAPSCIPSPFQFPTPFQQDQGTSLRSDVTWNNPHRPTNPFPQHPALNRPSYLTWGAEQFSSFMETASSNFQSQLTSMQQQMQQSLTLIGSLNERHAGLCSQQNTMLSQMAMSSVPQQQWIPGIHNDPNHIARRQAEAQFYAAAPQAPSPSTGLRDYARERMHQKTPSMGQQNAYIQPSAHGFNQRPHNYLDDQQQAPGYPPYPYLDIPHYQGGTRPSYQQDPHSQQQAPGYPPYPYLDIPHHQGGTRPSYQPAPYGPSVHNPPQFQYPQRISQTGACAYPEGYPSGTSGPHPLQSHPGQYPQTDCTRKRRGSESSDCFRSRNESSQDKRPNVSHPHGSSTPPSREESKS